MRTEPRCPWCGRTDDDMLADPPLNAPMPRTCGGCGREYRVAAAIIFEATRTGAFPPPPKEVAGA